MLAERFLPGLFDQIASAAAGSANGQCEGLGPLEASAGEDVKPTAARGTTAKSKVGADGKDAPKGEAVKPAESPLLVEWLSSKAIRVWAAVKPSLASVDLRPYLFVTKDRKDYFGAASVLGHLATVVEQLLGPKIIVQGMDADLKRLAAPEAEQVFEAVRGRIVGGDVLDTEPPGAAGLLVLVKAHPALQASLVAFLEGLPTDKLGAWAVAGWEGVFRDPETAARFDRLVGSWAVSAKNPILKAVAAAAKKVGGLR
jgi:hypothetical protein